MSKVVLDVSMSLDGFIAGPNGREAEPRRIPPRKSGPPRRSRGTPIRIQRRATLAQLPQTPTDAHLAGGIVA
jgi:hypothetical protein